MKEKHTEQETQQKYYHQFYQDNSCFFFKFDIIILEQNRLYSLTDLYSVNLKFQKRTLSQTTVED